MSSTHDYPTRKVLAKDLNNTMTLVGESGGLSSIYEAEPSNIAFGMLNITTEHGPLYLDPDEHYDVLDVDDPVCTCPPQTAALGAAHWITCPMHPENRGHEGTSQ